MKIECKWHLNEAYWSMTQRRNNMRSQPQWLLSDLFVWCFWNGRHLQDTPADSTKWSRSFSPPNSSQPWRSWRNFPEIPLYFPAQDLHHQHPSTIMDFMIEWIQWFESESAVAVVARQLRYKCRCSCFSMRPWSYANGHRNQSRSVSPVSPPYGVAGEVIQGVGLSNRLTHQIAAEHRGRSCRAWELRKSALTHRPSPHPIPGKGSSFDCEAVLHCLDVEFLFFRALNLWNKFGSTFSNIQIPMKLHAANRIFLTSLAPGPGPWPWPWHLTKGPSVAELLS